MDGFLPSTGNGDRLVWFKDWKGGRMLCNKVPFMEYADTQVKVKDIWINGIRHLDKIRTHLDLALKGEPGRLRIFCHNEAVDEII